MTDYVRQDRKRKPPHRAVRQYAHHDVIKAFAVEKPLPEEIWQSVKKAVGIEGKFRPEK
jgi:hypothetical protein